MATRIAPASVHKLTMANQFKLMQYALHNYVIDDISDDKFAEAAETALGFKVTKSNVAGVRRAMDIESTIDRRARERREDEELKRKLAAEDKAAGQTRLDRLEARILKLEQELFYLKKSLGA